MPVSEISGVAGTLNLGGGRADTTSPIQGFAEQLMRMKEIQKKSDMDTIEAATKIAEMGDVETAEKMGGPALQRYASHLAGKGGQGSPSLFANVAEQAAKKRKEESDLRAAQIDREKQLTATSKADQDEKTAQQWFTDLEKKAIDPSVPEDERQGYQSAFLMHQALQGKPVDLESLAFTKAPSSVQAAILDRHQQNQLRDVDKQKYVDDNAKNSLDMFGGDLAKATDYWTARYEGKTPSIQPSITSEFIEKNLKMLATAAEMGLSRPMTTDLIAAGGDPKKVKGWDKATINTLAMRNTAAQEKIAEADKSRAESTASLTKSEVAKNFAVSLQDLAKAQYMREHGGKEPAQFTQLLDLMKEARVKGAVVNDPAFRDRIKSMAGEVLGLSPVQQSTWFGLGEATNWVFNPAGGGGTSPDASNQSGVPASGPPKGAYEYGQAVGELPGALLSGAGQAGYDALSGGASTTEELIRGILGFSKGTPGKTDPATEQYLEQQRKLREEHSSR